MSSLLSFEVAGGEHQDRLVVDDMGEELLVLTSWPSGGDGEPVKACVTLGQFRDAVCWLEGRYGAQAAANTAYHET